MASVSRLRLLHAWNTSSSRVILTCIMIFLSFLHFSADLNNLSLGSILDVATSQTKENTTVTASSSASSSAPSSAPSPWPLVLSTTKITAYPDTLERDDQDGESESSDVMSTYILFLRSWASNYCTTTRKQIKQNNPWSRSCCWERLVSDRSFRLLCAGSGTR